MERLSKIIATMPALSNIWMHSSIYSESQTLNFYLGYCFNEKWDCFKLFIINVITLLNKFLSESIPTTLPPWYCASFCKYISSTINSNNQKLFISVQTDYNKNKILFLLYSVWTEMNRFWLLLFIAKLYSRTNIIIFHLIIKKHFLIFSLDLKELMVPFHLYEVFFKRLKEGKCRCRECRETLSRLEAWI